MNIIRKYRRLNKISMQVLATKAGVHINTIWRFENEECSPSIQTLKKLSQVTKIPVEELF